MNTASEVPLSNRRPTRRRNILLIILGLLLATLVITMIARRRADPKRELELAIAAFADDDLQTVEEAMNRFQQRDELQPHSMLLAGMLLLREGELFDAIDCFGAANEHPDTKALAYAFSGEALYKARQFRDADRILNLAVELDPTNVNNHRWLAATYYDIGAMHNALTELEIVAGLDAEDPRPNRLRGLIYRDYEKYAEAVHEYRQSLQRSRQQPDVQDILFELAECQLKLRRYSEALQVLAEASPSPDVWTLQAECYFAEGQIDKAKIAVNKALAADTNHIAAVVLAAKIAIEEKDFAAAKRILEAAASQHPKEYLIQFKLAEVYRLSGEQDKAEKQAKLAEHLRDLRTRFTKLHDQAIEDAADADIRYQLGLVAAELEKWDLAISWFRAALALDPAHDGAADALSRLTSPPNE